MRQPGTILILTFTALTCLGQGKLISTIPLSGKVHFASVDRPGDLYIIMEDGLVRKFDLNGKEIASKKFVSPPTLFDPRDGTLSFAYFRDHQRLEYLSPDMSSSTEKQLPPEFTVYPWQVCPARNELWILDSADLSLKQTAGRATTVGYEAKWQGKPARPSSITFMREYLNFLFILDVDNGIHVFNNLGRHIRQIDQPGLKYFNFLGEELYYMQGQSVQLMDLYTGELRQLAIPKPCTFALLTDQRMILVSDGKVEFFEFVP